MTSFPTTINELIMTNTQVAVLSIIALTTWLILYRYMVKKTLRNLPGPPSESFIKGNFMQLFDLNGWDYQKKILAQYGRIIRVKALFGENQLYISDLTAIHHIIVKDQNIYEEATNFFDLNRILMGEGIFSSWGAQHRRQRKMLTPVFSIARLRPMIHVFRDVTEKLRNSLMSKATKDPQEVDILHWMTRTALELIGQSGFGYSFDPLTEDATPHPYSTSARSLMVTVFRLIVPINYLLPIACKIGTPRFQRFVVDWIPWKDMHELRDIIDTLHNTSIEIVETKRKALSDGDKALEDQIAKGKDIMSILLRDNMNASPEDRLSDKEMIGQINSLTFAAMDTTSGALTRTISLLCSYPDVQEKLRQEILEASANSDGDLSYDQLMALPYLDAVCKETLRLYPPASMLRRVAREAIMLPLSEPIKGNDGRDIYEIHIPKGTGIVVSVLAANCNPEIWGPDSYDWKPERWLSPLPDTLHKSASPGVYSHLMTFSGGGRACIGFKFSQLEMKVVLFTLLESLKFSSSEKEIYWKIGGSVSPMVKGDESHPQLPTIVSLV